MNYALALFLLLIAGCATPVTGGKGITGGATEQRVSESKYFVTAGVNGYTSSAALKPTVLRRANLIAESQGFASFQIDSFNVSFDPRGNGYSSEVLLSFSRTPDAPIPNWRYAVGSESVTAYKASLPQEDLRGLVKLSGSKRYDANDTLVLIEPAFIDAIGSDRNLLGSGISDAYVRPGLLEFAAYARVNTGLFRPRGAELVKVRALVAPNSSYTLVGRLVGGDLEYWLEDDLTKEPANALERQPVLLR